MKKHFSVVSLPVRLVLWAGLLAGLSVPACAQKGKVVKNFLEGAPRAAAEQKAASSVSKKFLTVPSAQAPFCRAAGSRQLYFRFEGEPVQMEIPFSKENLPAALPVDQELQATLNRLLVAQTPAAKKDTFLTLPSGERVRVVELGPEHFKRTHQLKATVNYLMRSTSKPVVLRIRQTGEKVTVFINDRLRYFADVHRACPAGSYLLRYEDGRTVFLTPRQAPKSLKEAYTRGYRALHPRGISVQFAQEEAASRPQLPQIERLADLFTPRNSYAEVYALPEHPANKQPVTVAVLHRNIQIKGGDTLLSGSVLVSYKDGSFDLHPYNLVPPLLQEKIALLKNATKASASAPEAPALRAAVLAPRYDNQNKLAQDLHRVGLNAKRYKSVILGDVVAYEIPAPIYYQPAGRQGEMLDPQRQVVVYIPKLDGGQILDKNVLNNPILFIPVP